jgi:protein phosphatase
MALTLNIGKCTLLGNYRENNEDCIDVKHFPDLNVCIVADGMGGQAAGEVASRRAVEVIPRELRRALPTASGADATKIVVKKSIVAANEEIIQMADQDRDKKNMGTTVVVAIWRKGSELFVAGVGDSRAYLVRGKKIEQLTVDHSLAQALVEAKTISAAEAKEHRFKNILWKYLGTREVGEGPEVRAMTIQPGDRFLLCTDGLTGAVTDEKLLDFMLSNSDPQQCADGLGQLALDSGSKDNVSCVVIDVIESR